MNKKGRYLQNSSEKGFALITTLLITAILVAVISEIVYVVYTYTRIAASYRDGQRAASLAEGGIVLAASSIAEIMKGKNYTLLKPEDAVRVVSEGDGVLTLRVEDEQAKLNPNSIISETSAKNMENYAAYSRLLKVLGLKDELAGTLADWIGINKEPKPLGGKPYEYYERTPRPFEEKKELLDSTDEILLARGYMPEVYKRLSPFLTVYTDGRININTAPKEVIMALSSDITEKMAQGIIGYREKTPFITPSDISKVGGFETTGSTLAGGITVKSSIFRIFSRGSVGEGVREVEAVVNIQAGRTIYFWRQR
ncbi:MAG TPA: type II secretion system minor pseudopilin GspK [Candidatus Brocadiaceae bacterium]